jgi:hypothetical protein
MSNYLKDPDAKLDYGFDWSDWLASGETIITSTWAVPLGLTKVSDSFSTTATTVWVTDGTVGEAHVITNHITTSAGREDDRSHTLKIKDR